jgi:ABC-type sulfate transport system permease component
VIGSSETATTYVRRSFEGFDKQGAYSISVVLALIALATVLLMTLLRPTDQES